MQTFWFYEAGLTKDLYVLSLGLMALGVLMLVSGVMQLRGKNQAALVEIMNTILTNALPHDKMGIYMGIFNYFIVIPQIVAAAILGFFLQKFFHSEAIYALIIGGISMFLASVLTLFVKDKN